MVAHPLCVDHPVMPVLLHLPVQDAGLKAQESLAQRPAQHRFVAVRVPVRQFTDQCSPGTEVNGAPFTRWSASLPAPRFSFKEGRELAQDLVPFVKKGKSSSAVSP